MSAARFAARTRIRVVWHWAQVLRRLVLLVLPALCAAAPAPRPGAERIEFHIPPQPLDEALLAFSQQSGLELAAVGDFAAAARSRGVSGVMTPQAALLRLLDGQPFAFSIRPDGIVTVSPLQPRAAAAPQPPARKTLPAQTVPVIDLATVVVTARNRDERLIDVPIALSAISGERIDELGIDNAATAVKLAPGVASVDAGGGFTQLQIRGVSSSIGGNDNGYYLDDMAFTGLTVPWHPDTRAFDLDRIEILKGPQGTLFGEGSMGGTVRILTRAPELDRFGAKAETGYTSTQHGGTGFGAKGMLNLPIVPDRLALRVVSTQETLPGWIDDPIGGRHDVNRQELATTRARLRWSPDDHWLSDVTYVRSTSDAPSGDYSADDFGDTRALTRIRSTWEGKSLVSGYANGPSRFTYLYSDTHLDYGLNGKLTPTLDLDATIRIAARMHELRWTYDVEDRLNATVGYSHRVAERRDALLVDGVVSMAEQTNRADSLYGETTLRSRDLQWSLTAGMRYFTDAVNGATDQRGSGAEIHSRFDSLTPRVILTRQVSADHLLYASASSGFRSGQLQPATALFVAQQTGAKLPPSVAPDKIRSYEAGFKRLFADRRVQLEGAVFESHWKDLPVRVPISDSANGIINSKGALIRGVEVGLRYASPSRLTLELGASALDAAYLADVPDTPLKKGSQVYNVPRFTASLTAGYRWNLRHGLTGVASASTVYNSARQTPLTVGPHGDAIVVTDLRAGVESPAGWAWYAYVDNLGGEDGAVAGRSDFGNAVRLRPRTFGLQFRYDY